MLNVRNFKIGSRLISTTIGALGLMIAFVIIALIGLSKVGVKAQVIAVENAATADHVFSMLMGDDVAPRRQFIEENATYAKIDA